jgi:hypothetical protein
MRAIRNFVKLVSTISGTGAPVNGFCYQGTQYEVENTIGDTLWFKLVRVNHLISGYYSGDGCHWKKLEKILPFLRLTLFRFFDFYRNASGFYLKGNQDAWFDFYIYRDAYTPILAECPATSMAHLCHAAVVELARWI